MCILSITTFTYPRKSDPHNVPFQNMNQSIAKNVHLSIICTYLNMWTDYMDAKDIVMSNMMLICATELSRVVLITLVLFVCIQLFGFTTIIGFVRPLGHTCFPDINANWNSGEDLANYKTHTITHVTLPLHHHFSEEEKREEKYEQH